MLTNGTLTGESVFTDEGRLDVTSFDAATGRLEYVYTLTGATQEHVGDSDAEVEHDLVVTIEDTDGDIAEAVIAVVIGDDVPEAVSDSASVKEGAVETAEGNVLENDVSGADGFGRVEWSGVSSGSRYVLNGDNVFLNGERVGSLSLGSDGRYVFTLDSGFDVPQEGLDDLVLEYRVYDGDGDYRDSTLTIAVSGDDRTPVLPTEPGGSAAQITVDEGALAGSGSQSAGSGQHTEHGAGGSGAFSVQLNGEDGWTVAISGSGATVSGSSVTVNGVMVNVTGASQAADGSWLVSYDYALVSGSVHTNPDASGSDDTLAGSIPVDVTDATGDTASGFISVDVHDDAPLVQVASPDPVHASDEAVGVLEGEFSVNFGADGQGDFSLSYDGHALQPTGDGSHVWSEGGMTLLVSPSGMDADGNVRYSYRLEYDSSAVGSGFDGTLTITATDGDGDTVSRDMVLSVENRAPGQKMTDMCSTRKWRETVRFLRRPAPRFRDA